MCLSQVPTNAFHQPCPLTKMDCTLPTTWDITLQIPMKMLMQKKGEAWKFERTQGVSYGQMNLIGTNWLWQPEPGAEWSYEVTLVIPHQTAELGFVHAGCDILPAWINRLSSIMNQLVCWHVMQGIFSSADSLHSLFHDFRTIQQKKLCEPIFITCRFWKFKLKPKILHLFYYQALVVRRWYL